jgi:hypothetical protein
MRGQIRKKPLHLRAHDRTPVPLPKLVTMLQVEAVELRGGWEGFDETPPPHAESSDR